MRIAKAIASFFYVGFIPVIPGTFGSLAGLILYFLLQTIPYWQVYLGVVVIVTFVGVWSAGKAEKESGIVDPSFVVIDEVAGQLITLFLIPPQWLYVLGGFLLFRFLDIVKPIPARQAERLPHGWGIMSDDVLVGIYGCILMHGGVYIWERLF
ncbi:phosphatidylglycerophosphatase A [bacterium]|nr:phosphatidylglycerophosphatase A [bacterium]MCI0604825.1 phosphatidylglycerophosphatase A [bacterium]